MRTGTGAGGGPSGGAGQMQQPFSPQGYGSGLRAPSSGPPPGMGGTAFVPGKIFIGGLANTTTKDQLESYCAQWCVCPSTLCMAASQPALELLAADLTMTCESEQGRDVGYRAHGGPRLWVCDLCRPAMRSGLLGGELTASCRL